MRCPRDNQLLNRKMSERLFGNGCNLCDGIFLAGKKNQIYANNIKKQLHENSLHQMPSSDLKLLCPDCKTQMNVTRVDKVEIDICHKCLGVWFDKTEAQALIQKYNRDTSSENKTNLAPFPSEFVQTLSKWFLHKS